jgi:hypothetical protein
VISRFIGTTNLSVTPGGPACPSRASGWEFLSSHRLGLPMLRQSPCVHVSSPITPVGTLGQIARRPAYSGRTRVRQRRRPSPLPERVGSHVRDFRGLLSVYVSYNPRTRHPVETRCCHEGSDGFVTSTAAPLATGWSDPVAGQELHLLRTVTFLHGVPGVFPMLCIGRPERFQPPAGCKAAWHGQTPV